MEKPKRIVSKIGNVFCVQISPQEKKYFQYIANDRLRLNSSVIRVFERVYRSIKSPNWPMWCRVRLNSMHIRYWVGEFSYVENETFSYDGYDLHVHCKKQRLTHRVKRGYRKKGELLTSHRYDHIPVLESSPGGFCRSWSYKTHPGTKVGKFYHPRKHIGNIFFAGIVFLSLPGYFAGWFR